jgi:hypothetical protein
MEEVARLAVATESGEEQRFPYLHLWHADGSMILAALAVAGAGPAYAATARAVIATASPRPVVAVISQEAWMADLPHNPDDATDPFVRDWLRRREAGEPLGVVDLPPDYRQEVLILIGEDAAGQERLRVFQIKPALGPPPAPRQLVEKGTVEREHSDRFRPLFALEWAQRTGIPERIARAAIARELAAQGAGNLASERFPLGGQEGIDGFGHRPGGPRPGS